MLTALFETINTILLIIQPIIKSMATKEKKNQSSNNNNK